MLFKVCYVFQGWNKYLSKHRLTANIQDMVSVSDTDTDVKAKHISDKNKTCLDNLLFICMSPSEQQ